MIEFVLLAVKTGNFGMDILFPAVAGAVVLAMIANSFLHKWGYGLW